MMLQRLYSWYVGKLVQYVEKLERKNPAHAHVFVRSMHPKEQRAMWDRLNGRDKDGKEIAS